MWGNVYLLSLLLTNTFPSKITINVIINRTLNRLEKGLNYLRLHYEKINGDCLFGVVFVNALFHDAVKSSNLSTDHKDQITNLQTLAGDLYNKSASLLKDQPNWDFVYSVITPEIWLKSIGFNNSLPSLSAYPDKKRMQALFSSDAKAYFSEAFSDFCLSEIVAQTKSRHAIRCNLSGRCWEKFVQHSLIGSGYIITHKLLLFQLAKARGCSMTSAFFHRTVGDLCSIIYSELISAEHYGRLNDIFDLFLEQSVLCGYEGYRAFLKLKWLDYVLNVQHRSGCFPAVINSRLLGETRQKRDTNVWDDGCADHTTGLGLATLALYANYLFKEYLT